MIGLWQLIKWQAGIAYMCYNIQLYPRFGQVPYTNGLLKEFKFSEVKSNSRREGEILTPRIENPESKWYRSFIKNEEY